MRKPLPFAISVAIFCAIILINSTLKAQSVWHPLQTANQVQIEHSDPVICSFSEGTVQAEYIFLKISNFNHQAVQVSFRLDVYNVGIGCATCANDEYKYTFNIPANGSIQADCNFNSTGNTQLAIFKKFITKTNKREFERFEITNLTVE